MWVPEESDTRSGGTNKQRGEQVCRAPRSRRKVSRGQNRWKAGGAVRWKVREAGQGQV